MPNPLGSGDVALLYPRNHGFGVAFDDVGKLGGTQIRLHTLSMAHRGIESQQGNCGDCGEHGAYKHSLPIYSYRKLPLEP